MLESLAAICAGASLGAVLRWLLSVKLNPLFPALPLGTLAANLAGGYLVGVAVALAAQQPGLSPAMRLFVITGFLGGLTTFSTFSAEVVTQLQQGHTAWALATALAHLLEEPCRTQGGLAASLELALAEYDRIRLPRRVAVADYSRRMGRRYHWTNPVKRQVRTLYLQALGTRLLDSADWIYGHDKPTAARNHPSST